MATGSRGSMRARFSRALAVDEHLREAAVGKRHDRLARAERGDLAHRERALLLAGELVADELLGLEHVGRDDVGFGAHRLAQRLAVGVDDGRHLEPLQVADQRRVDVGLDAARQRAGEHDDRGAAREVQQLVAEQLDLVARTPTARVR